MAHATPLSRRALLAISAAAAAAGTASCSTTSALAQAIAPVNPDAELLRLDQEHDAAYAKTLGAGAGPDGLDDEELTEICDDLRDVEFAIHRIPAYALAGPAVKARLASVYFEPEPSDLLMMGIFTSLVEDILRMADVTAKHPIALPYPAKEA